MSEKRYQLTIEEFAPNPNYAAELEAYNKRARELEQEPPNRYGYVSDRPPLPMPTPENLLRVLSCSVTEAEFQTIKVAAVDVMGMMVRPTLTNLLPTEANAIEKYWRDKVTP